MHSSQKKRQKKTLASNATKETPKEDMGGRGIFRQDWRLEGVLVCHPAEGQHVGTFPPFPHGVVYGAYPSREREKESSAGRQHRQCAV